VIVKRVFPADDYDLAATLASGQCFRWRRQGQNWEGVIGSHWVRLTATAGAIAAETVTPVATWEWLVGYLQLEADLSAVLRTFPDDEPMRAAIAGCRGLRLLRQDPWECLGSFILSSSKQIVQIQQIAGLLCERYGQPVPTPSGAPPAFAFPCPASLAAASEVDLRACKMGFRAPYLLGTARAIAEGRLDLEQLRRKPLEEAREQLLQLPGVGRKIADCVLLFGYGFERAFPVDVWVMKALRQLYFPRRRVGLKQLHRFAAEHFGPCAGYAQQYLFHYMRTRWHGATREDTGPARVAGQVF
jgi:N-glycosylase/DNA lyase